MQEGIKYFPHINLVLIGMGMFIFAFTGLVIVVLNKSRNKFYRDMAALPLGTEGKNE